MNIEKQFFFMAGLPRSGSTVLSSILNQNENVFVTPTSPLLEILVANKTSWESLPSVIANPEPKQITNISKSIINGCWEHINKPIIIDKNRGWGKNHHALTVLFENSNPKFIATYRDLPSIMASWLTLLRNNPNNYLDNHIRELGFEVNDDNRMAEMWFNMVRDCMESLHQLHIDAKDDLLLINYDDLVYNPSQEINKITKFLNLPEHTYDYNNIINNNIDDDLKAWGLSGMHQIRPKLEKISKNPKEVLGESLYNRFVELEKQYNFGV